MSLRDFLEKLRLEGLLLNIEERVSPEFEAPKIAREHSKPIFFKDVAGKKAVMNVISSREILALALGVRKEEIVRYLAGVKPEGEIKIVEEMPFLERQFKADLSKLPIMRHYREDAGKYITAGVVISRLGEEYNASVHRMLVLDKRTLAVRLVPPRHCYLMHKKAAEQRRELPVGVAIGVDPLFLLAACTRVPECREFQYTSALSGKPLELYELENGVQVPDAEIVLEGYVDPEARAREGPFVDITGTLDIVREEPVIKLNRIYMRRDAIYQGILPGGSEHKLLMGVPYEPKIYKTVGEVARVRNVLLTEGGCCYFHAVVQIEKQTEGDGKNAILATFTAHPSLKHVVVVDDDIDIYNQVEVEYAIATRVRGDRDILIIPRARGSSLDPAIAEDGTTTKVGIDATKPLIGREKFKRVEME
ncbi:MAG: UbiD family decarboxylase [Methanocellales archaeon]